MKVLLISANQVTNPYPVYPLGLDYIGTVLEPDNQVKIIDMNCIDTPSSLAPIISDYAPEIIGLSLRNIDNTEYYDSKSYLSYYRELAQTIRSVSSAPLVLGGSAFSIFPNELLNSLDADYGIIGEGEILLQLLEVIKTNGSASQIPGIITQNKKYSQPGPLANIVKPDFNPDKTQLQFYLKRGGMLNLQTKRGCNYKCIYCTYPLIEGKELRLLPPRQIAQTARQLQDAGAQYLFITDSVFNNTPKHNLAIAEEFIKEKITIPWGAFFSPTNMPKDYFATMAQAGLTHVEFGSESFSDRMLKTYRKPFTVSDIYRAHQSAVEAGLYVAHYILFGGPGENRSTIDESLENISKVKKAVFFYFCGIRIYPDTELYTLAVENKQITESQNLLEPIFYNSTDIDANRIKELIQEKFSGNTNFMHGSGGDEVATTLDKLYARGYTGPLWEFLIK